MVIAEFQVGLALKGFASKLTVPNYRVKWGADFSPPKWMFCPKANAKHAQIWIFLGSNSLLGIHLSQQLKNFKIFYHLQSLREAFMESICPKIGGLTVLAKWNMIFCLYGAFSENSLSKQNFHSPHILAVCMQGEGESLSFLYNASCTVHGFA